MGIVALAAVVLCVAGIVDPSHLPDTGERVMVLSLSPSGIYEWDGPYTVEGRTEDGRVSISKDGLSKTVDFPHAIPLSEYRRVHDEKR